jgi:hypothetical protein
MATKPPSIASTPRKRLSLFQKLPARSYSHTVTGPLYALCDRVTL